MPSRVCALLCVCMFTRALLLSCIYMLVCVCLSVCLCMHVCKRADVVCVFVCAHALLNDYACDCQASGRQRALAFI